MGSNFHYPIDLNEDQNHKPFFCAWGSHDHQASPSPLPLPLPSSSSSPLSYLPFFNSPEQHGGYTYHADPHHLSQPLQANMYISSGGSCEHTLPKKEPRLKLTIRKKELDRSCDQLDTSMGESSTNKWRLTKNVITNKEPKTTDNPAEVTNSEEEIDHKINMSPMSLGTDHTINENGYSNNNGVIRVCSDCNTTKTPLWRSGPRGPKSLCNACGIRQRKARRAAMAAAAAASAGVDDAAVAPPLPPQLTVKKKTQNKNKRSSHSNGGDHQAKTKKCKIMEDSWENHSKSWSSSSSSSNSKLCFDDLTIILSKSSAFQKVFPQDEKEAAILLMALSYGMVHG